jgi:hypothetical protein
MDKAHQVITSGMFGGNERVQWLLLPHSFPALSAKEFGSSKTLFDSVSKRFSLADQFRNGAVQQSFSEFSNSIRPLRMEATALQTPFPNLDVHLIAPKSQKCPYGEKVMDVIDSNSKFLSVLLNAKNLEGVWNRATSLEESVVGGYHMDEKFMFLFGRPPLEDAKSLFGIPENFERYKPSKNRDPALLSREDVAVAVAAYPEQIEKSYEHLQYFLRAGRVEKRLAVCYISNQFDEAARAKLYSNKPSDVYILTQPRFSHTLLTHAREVLKGISEMQRGEAISFLKSIKPPVQSGSAESVLPGPY